MKIALLSCAMIAGFAAQAEAQTACATASDTTAEDLPFGVIVDNSSNANTTTVTCGTETHGADVWLQTPVLTAGKAYRITTSEAAGSTVNGAFLEVFSGSCGNLAPVACSTASGAETLFASLDFVATETGSHLILTESLSEDDAGQWMVTISEVEPELEGGLCGLGLDLRDAVLPIELPIDPTGMASSFALSCAPDAGGADALVTLPPLAANRRYTIETASLRGSAPVNTRIELLAGDSCSDAVPVACNDDIGTANVFSRIEFLPQQGKQYFVLVEAVTPGESTPFVLKLDEGLEVPPASNCSIAPLLPSGVMMVVEMSEAVSTTEASCSEGEAKPELWFRLPELSSRMLYTIETLSEGAIVADTRLEVFSGQCGRLQTIACNDDIEPGINPLSRVQFRGDASQDYYVLIEADQGASPLLFFDGGVLVTPPENDICSEAVVIPPASLPWSQTTPAAGASDDGMFVPVGSAEGGADLFYRFTPRVAGRYTFKASFSGAGDSIALGLWTGESCDALSPFCGGPVDRPSPAISVWLEPTETVFVTIDDATPESPSESYTLTVEGPATGSTTSNNTCATATPVTALPFTATEDPSANKNFIEVAPAIGGDACLGEMFYQIPGSPNDRVIHVKANSTEEGQFPAAVAVFAGSCATELTPAGPVVFEQGRFLLEAGYEYIVVVEPFAVETQGPIRVDIVGETPEPGYTCAEAVPIPAAPFSTDVVLARSSDNSADIACLDSTAGLLRRSVFFSFRPEATGNYRIAIDEPASSDPEAVAAADSAIAVYTGDCSASEPISCINRTVGGEILTISLEAGVDYLIQIEGLLEGTTADSLPFTLVSVPAPAEAGDSCPEAFALSDSAPAFSHTIDISGNAPASPVGFLGPTAMYRYASGRAGILTITASPESPEVDVALTALVNYNEDPCDLTWARYYSRVPGPSQSNTNGPGKGATGVERLVLEMRPGEPALIVLDSVTLDGGVVAVDFEFEAFASDGWMLR